MAEMPIMPLATDAALADTGDLPNELFGAYWRLMMRWWREGCEPVASEKKLQRWAQCSADDFAEIRDEFLTHTDDGWVQKGLFRRWEAQQERKHKAYISSLVRWHKEGKHRDDAHADCPLCECTASAKPDECDRNANASDVHANASSEQCERSADAMLSMNHEPILVDDDSARARVRQIRDVCEPVMASPAASAAVASLVEPFSWAKRADFESFVLPALTRIAGNLAAKRAPPIGSWSYFGKALAGEAERMRAAAAGAPEVGDAPTAPPQSNAKMDSLRRFMEAGDGRQPSTPGGGHGARDDRGIPPGPDRSDPESSVSRADGRPSGAVHVLHAGAR